VPLFKYDAFNKLGKKVSGTIEASTIQTAKEIIRSQGFMPIKMNEIAALDAAGGFSIKDLFERSVDQKSIILLTKQLAVLLKAGVPLLQGVELLAEQFEGKLRRILIEVKDDLKSGKSFATSLERYPKVFSNVYVQLVRAGEASGNLEAVLKNLAVYLERMDEIRRRVKKAMSYPVMMIGISVVIVSLLITFAVPKIVEVFKESGIELPWPTRFVLGISDFFSAYLFWIVVFSIGGFILFKYWKSTPNGRHSFDKLKLQLPIFSYFTKAKVVVDFTKTFGMLLESGVNLAESLDIVCNLVDNTVLTRTLKNARDKIIKEGKISKYLGETQIFPPIVSYMVSTGEQSGKLAEMLTSVGNDYERDLFELIDSLIAKINPLMILIVGGLIFFIVLAMFLPMKDIGSAFEKMG